MAASRVSTGFSLFIALIASCGIAGSIVVYFFASNTMRDEVLHQTSVVAAAIRSSDIAQLIGSDEDLDSATYIRVKEYLTRVRASSDEIRFAYVLGENTDREVFFYVDSEDPSSPDYSPPGQVYYEATPTLRSVFADGEARTEGPERDRWGTWVSGFVPVVNADGTVLAIVGLDLPDEHYTFTTLVFSGVPLLIAAFVIALAYYIRARTRR